MTVIKIYIQEYGTYILRAEECITLITAGMGVEKDDYIFMASYCIQGGYCTGKDDFIYIYSKDCNRDATSFILKI